jgi:hypothetical protein
MEPTRRGYIYVAACVQPHGAVVLPTPKRFRLLRRLKDLTRGLERVEGVIKGDVFRAIIVPPPERFSMYLQERTPPMQPADFDVAALVQTISPSAAQEVARSAAYRALVEAMRTASLDRRVFTMVAHNAKRIANVDTSRDGLFLFNHFAADDPSVMLHLWDYLADWYTKETGLNNSIALVPEAGQRSDYSIVNWARWEMGPLRHFWHQLSKKSFWRYITQNLEANHAASMPIYCRLA